jgi:endonuclease III
MNIKLVLRTLKKTHQPTMLEKLNHYTPFQLLVMTLLSARAKDATTIPIVVDMFKKYPNPEDYIDLDLKVIEKMIFKIGFYRVKAKYVQNLSRMLLNKFNGVVPDTLEELTSLPGVGRKTANCILAYVFKKPAIAVDIHVHRIANRLGWVSTKNEAQTEQELMKLVPKDEWININSMLVGHGQTICAPIKPRCNKCQITKLCNYDKKNL